MQELNEQIKKALQSNLHKIDDDFFTRRIVDKHLANKQNKKYLPFVNFFSLIIGLSFLLASIGLVFVLRQGYDWMSGISVTEQHGLILIALSIIFLTYKSLEEFTTHSPA
jgi:hypothetical protein